MLRQGAFLHSGPIGLARCSHGTLRCTTDWESELVGVEDGESDGAGASEERSEMKGEGEGSEGATTKKALAVRRRMEGVKVHMTGLAEGAGWRDVSAQLERIGSAPLRVDMCKKGTACCRFPCLASAEAAVLGMEKHGIGEGRLSAELWIGGGVRRGTGGRSKHRKNGWADKGWIDKQSGGARS